MKPCNEKYSKDHLKLITLKNHTGKKRRWDKFYNTLTPQNEQTSPKSSNNESTQKIFGHSNTE